MYEIIFKCLLLFIIVLINNINCRTSDILKITLPNNSKLIGRYLRSNKGNGIRAFMGIPFAQPPIGDLRFAAPVPAEPWTDEKLMINESPVCIQRSPYLREYDLQGSEDCLYLNVFTPQFADPLKPLAVLVFFHGGGWMEGSKDGYLPDFLLDHDVILVTANYRLGPLGFLSSGQKDCPGNFGLKDNVLTLKWIQENINVFGGDTKRVTIFGMSAGASIVAYLMQSPLANGLFHGAISESGNNLNYWSQPAHKGVAEKRATRVAELLNCAPVTSATTTDCNWSEIIKCLRSKSANDITKTIYNFFEWDFDPEIPFTPVVEPNLPGAFITEHPRNVRDTYGINVPYIIGMNLNEGLLKTAPLVTIPGLYADFKQKWKTILPISLYYDHMDKNVQDEITNNITQFYFDNKLVDEWKFDNLTNLYTDSGFMIGLDEYLRMRLRGGDTSGDAKASSSIFVYLFNHEGAASFAEIFVPDNAKEMNFGVCHADELRTLFPMEKIFISSVPTELDIEIRETMIKFWVNFAKTGDPTPTTDNYGVKWRPATKFPLDYLQIGQLGKAGQQLTMKSGLFEDRAKFWHDIQPFLPERNADNSLW